MIVRVWGIVNAKEIEFQRVPDRPDYWEGYAPKFPGYQNVEIWAENDKGARGHLKCQVLISYENDTTARLLVVPYFTRLISEWEIRVYEDWRVRLV